jgi:hypothetical protein
VSPADRGPEALGGLNPKAEPAYGTVERQRLRHTIDFLGAVLPGPALDIGPKNDFGDRLAERFGIGVVNTEGDLDLDGWRPIQPGPEGGFPVVFCFEVIEHLLNPLLFLISLRRHCAAGARVFVTYPLRPRLFWSDIHWHEIDRRRFDYLLGQAGFVSVRFREKLLWREWPFYLTGVRPLLRLTVGRTRSQMYELRPRG